MANGTKNKTTKKKSADKGTDTSKEDVIANLPYKQIIPYVQDQMASDDDYKEKYNVIIQNHYKKATPEVRKVIDDIFACLCGWSLETIIKEADPLEEEEEKDDGEE